MDRCNPQLAKLQESFINHLVAPLCNAYGEAGLLPGHWVEASDSEDEGVPDKMESQTGRDTEDDTEGETSASGRPWKRPSQQLQPRKVSCLQTKHLQDNYEHWVNILKEENRLKEAAQQQGATSPRTAAVDDDGPDDAEDSDGADEDDDDDEEDDDDDIVVAGGADDAPGSPLQEEMETIQEVEEGGAAVAGGGGTGSTKTSPCKSRDHFLGVVKRPVGDAFSVSSGGGLTSGLCPCPSQEAASSAARTQGGAKTLAAVDDAVVSGASLPRPLPPSPLREGAASRGEPRSSRAGRPRYLTLRFWKRGNNT
ncbi:hypothetical protein HPB47_023277 [Ixodes persulcatus]|uniref:Uncharacterized protein n=1 Tax=Ixodes persulcatus TaxID=34615 RepID=A0AC60Q7U1_IXOPE|nr:hypothetical protein HPB47_023277 [Ixodes persulcatus]